MTCKTSNYGSDYGCAKEEVVVIDWKHTASNPIPTLKVKIKEIKLKQLDYGYVLNVGCKEIALDTPEKIVFALKKYLADPAKVENEFLNGNFEFEHKKKVSKKRK